MFETVRKFVMPTALLAGVLAGAGTMISSPSSAAPVPVVPTVTAVTPNAGPVAGGTSITVVGTGFAVGDTVEIGQGHGAGPTAIAASNVKVLSPTKVTAITGGGAESGSFHVFVVTQNGPSAGNRANAFDYVSASVTAVTPNTGPVAGGTPITVVGTGFAVGDTVEIGQGKGPGPTAIVATDVNVLSSTQITATTGGGAQSGSFHVFVVTPNGPSLAKAASAFAYQGPSILATPATGAPGTPFTCSGRGFPAADYVTIYMAADYVTAVTTSSTGAFSTTCTVPTTVDGSYSYTASDDTITVTGDPFTVVPGLSFGQTTATPSDTVTIEAVGFAASSTLSGATFDGVSVSLTPTAPTTDANGSASFSFTVPAGVKAGSDPLKVTDGVGDVGTRDLITYRPTLMATPPTGAPGTPFTCSGSGFPAADDLTVHIGADYITEVSASSTGTFSTSCTVPTTVGGSYPYSVTDYGTTNVTGHPFTVVPGVTFGQSAATPSDMVNVNVVGLAANSTLHATFGGKSVALAPSGTTTDANGSASFSFTVPAGVKAGSDVLKVTDGSGDVGIGDLSTTTPTLTISVSSGTPGTLLTCSGTGFPAADTLTIHIGANYVTAVTTSSAGTFSTSCTVPTMVGGSYSYSVTDYATTNVASQTFTVVPGVSFGQSTATPGDTVSVNVVGLAANSTLAATFGKKSVNLTPSGTTTDGNGSASFSFTVPAGVKAGSDALKVTDGSGDIGIGDLTTYTPALTISASKASPGTALTCSGTGFPVGDTPFVHIGNSGEIATPTADSTGAFSTPCSVPQMPAGTYAFSATNFGTINVTGHPFTVVPGVSLGQSTGTPGDTVTVTVVGLAANATTHATFDGRAVTLAPRGTTTDSNGSASFSFTVPAGVNAGSDALKVSDGFGDVGTGDLTTYTPTLTISVPNASPGTALTCAGTGFPAGEMTFIHIGKSGEIATPTADGTGAFSTPCSVPDMPAGTYAFSATDFGPINVTGSPFTVVPGLSVNPSAGSPGDVITVYVVGFAADSRLLATLDGNTVSHSVTTDDSGDATFTFTVTADMPPGSDSLQVSDGDGNVGAGEVTINPAS
jgi:hypothetical protein